jgi:xanthine dehydrogenase YagS FAD-binding subunit
MRSLTVISILLIVTGLILFLSAETLATFSHPLMRWMRLLHDLAAVVFAAIVIGHIYFGLIRVNWLALSELQRLLPALHMAASRVATPQIRNVGTIGGNLLQDSRCSYYRGPWHCYRAGGIVCDARHGVHTEHAIFGGERCITVTPSDVAPALVALEAQATIEGSSGRREVPVSEIFVLPAENIQSMHRLTGGEILTTIEVPLVGGQRSVFIKHALRNAWDFAIASVAAVRHTSGVRVVLGGVAPVPWRSFAAEDAVAGRDLTADTIEAAAGAAAEGAEFDDQTEYKTALVRSLVRSALEHLR